MNVARRRLALVVIACVLAALTTAAAGNLWGEEQTRADSTGTYSPDTSLPATAPHPEARCPGPGAPPVHRTLAGPMVAVKQLVLTTADGVKLAAVRVGGGGRGVVLVHEDDSDLCTWWAYARRLAAGGYHVLAFDLRCHGFSECGRRRDYAADAHAAVAALRAAGAARVVVAGTELGANVAVVAAARDAGTSTGAVALAPRPFDVPVTDESGPRTIAEAVPRLRVPVLVCLGELDAVLTLLGEAWRVLPRLCDGRGMDALTEGPDSVEPHVAAFLAAHT
ncbi:alpha/beta fold hydrolase [Luedemannella helvata]|uniref:AB hydrolase-1 domain-containing protein n=1 Tax=Luedemannella helvata TaxID=349315 RepID=A0ABN2JZR9_9ACTN